ncbi:Hypothetical_protein [Hexamita inflata]|uniref:Hypothetical_protein n=1 Tax=Hexamita inflata TaxID=28002 RepID=A0AA86PFA7_9EUKA|nr:Hypothetical protein HINF_LOCUS22600 [Hexamita inflata]
MKWGSKTAILLANKMLLFCDLVNCNSLRCIIKRFCQYIIFDSELLYYLIITEKCNNSIIIILINCFSQIIKFVPRFSDSVAILHFQLQKFLPFNPHLRADTGMPVQWSVAVPQHCFQSIRLTTIQICMSLSHF